jgi:hypothetical protein
VEDRGPAHRGIPHPRLHRADPGRRLTETAASSGVSRTSTDVLRATSAQARRRPRDTPVGTESLLVTTPSLTHVDVAPVPHHFPMEGPSRPHTLDTGRRPVRPATTSPAPAAHTPRPARPSPGPAPTPTPHGTAGRTVAQPHPPRRLIHTHAHPVHGCPPLVHRPSSKRSRNDGHIGPRTGICGQHARETRRCGQRADPPGSAPPSRAGSPTSRISCSAEGTAEHSSSEHEIRPSGPTFARSGERLGPPRCRRSYTAGEPRPRPTARLRTARRGIRSPVAEAGRHSTAREPGSPGGAGVGHLAVADLRGPQLPGRHRPPPHPAHRQRT